MSIYTVYICSLRSNQERNLTKNASILRYSGRRRTCCSTIPVQPSEVQNQPRFQKALGTRLVQNTSFKNWNLPIFGLGKWDLNYWDWKAQIPYTIIKNSCRQGRRELGGGWGKNYFRGPYCKKKYCKKNFQDNDLNWQWPVIAFVGLFPNFPYQISVLCPQNTNISAQKQKYFARKSDWGPTLNF